MLSIWITSHSSWVVNEVFLYFLVWKDQLASGINTMVWGQYKLSIILDLIPLYFLTNLETLKPQLDLLIFWALFTTTTNIPQNWVKIKIPLLIYLCSFGTDYTYNRAKLLFCYLKMRGEICRSGSMTKYFGYSYYNIT